MSATLTAPSAPADPAVVAPGSQLGSQLAAYRSTLELTGHPGAPSSIESEVPGTVEFMATLAAQLRG